MKSGRAMLREAGHGELARLACTYVRNETISRLGPATPSLLLGPSIHVITHRHVPVFVYVFVFCSHFP